MACSFGWQAPSSSLGVVMSNKPSILELYQLLRAGPEESDARRWTMDGFRRKYPTWAGEIARSSLWMRDDGTPLEIYRWMKESEERLNLPAAAHATVEIQRTDQDTLRSAATQTDGWTRRASWLLGSKRREVILGDLLENRAQLRKLGIPESDVNWHTASDILRSLPACWGEALWRLWKLLLVQVGGEVVKEWAKRKLGL